MSAEIPITGVPIDWRLPGPYLEILFGQGPATAYAGARDVCFVMPKTSSGTGVVNTRYPIKTEGDVETLGGPGSMAHRGIRKFLRKNKQSKVFLVLYNATSGGSPATATVDVTVAGGTSSGSGTATIWVAGEACSFSFPSGTTVTAIAAGLVGSINGKTYLPVTANNASGVVTISAKIAGASQGTATIGVIRVRAEITSGITSTIAAAGAHVGASVAGADGTTTEATNLTTALAVLDNERHYYIAISMWDATGAGLLKTHLQNKSLPRPGLRSVGIFGYTDTLANATTIATGRNYERLQMVWQFHSEHDTAELAGAMAAIRQLEEGVDTAKCLDDYSLSDLIQPAYALTDRPDSDDQNDAILDGITCIASSDVGAKIVMSVNTRSKNAGGTVDDFRAAETHRVSVADEFGDILVRMWSLRFAGKKLEADQFLPNGLVNRNQPNPPANTIRASIVHTAVVEQLDLFARGKLQELAATKKSLRCVKTGSRIETGVDLHVIDHAHQGTFRLAEVSPG